METILGNKFQPLKHYGDRIVHRGKQLCLVDEIFQFFRRKTLIIYCYFLTQKEK